MLDAGRQIREVRVPRDVELTPLKNRSEQEKNKDNEKEKRWKRETNERQWKMIFHEMILGLITLKHGLGLLILSFGTPNPSLHYVPRKSILIERGYLDWRVFFLEKSFIINKAVVHFPQPTKKNLDQSFTCSGWILNCQVHNRIVKKMMKKWKWKEKMTLGWKSERAV